ncbi:MAG: peptidylprolyl isomerase [Armatimonadota bacterium]|nr:peptidylprolyl isomerase [Armatimonadota bacterium]
MRKAFVLIITGFILATATLAATKESKNPTSKPQPQKNPIAVVEMEKGGTFEIELYPKEAPITAGNFINLVKKKFYDGLIFHRVEPGFVAQTGDPTGTGRGGPGYTIKDEKTPFKHDKGAVGMAKTRLPNSAGSQWYICLEPAHFLDGNYTVFGKVIKGMDVVEKIKVGDKIKKITLRMPPEPKPKQKSESKK